MLMLIPFWRATCGSKDEASWQLITNHLTKETIDIPETIKDEGEIKNNLQVFDAR